MKRDMHTDGKRHAVRRKGISGQTERDKQTHGKG